MTAGLKPRLRTFREGSRRASGASWHADLSLRRNRERRRGMGRRIRAAHGRGRDDRRGHWRRPRSGRRVTTGRLIAALALQAHQRIRPDSLRARRWRRSASWRLLFAASTPGGVIAGAAAAGLGLSAIFPLLWAIVTRSVGADRAGGRRSALCCRGSRRRRDAVARRRRFERARATCAQARPFRLPHSSYWCSVHGFGS